MSQPAEPILTIDHKPHAAFFRQSGWLMIAGIAGGAMSFGMHFLNKKIPDGEYANFGVLTMVLTCLPTLPLQMVFAQQAARGLVMNRERQLAGMIRLAWLWTFVLWALTALVALIFQGWIVKHWNFSSAAALWVTLPLLLMSVWLPVFGGVLQGRQDFFWLGWTAMIGGIGRLALATMLVLVFNGGAAGMMAGALLGGAASVGIVIWRTRDLWRLRPEHFDAKSLFREIVPLVFAFGACQLMFAADTIFTRPHFTDEQMKPYVAAGTLSRALLWLVLPLATVMFPKIVQSSAKAEKSNLLGIVLVGTAILGVCGVLGLWVVGPWVIKLVYKAEAVSATIALIPWYAGAMVPLALANVLANDLLARAQFRVVPGLVLVAVAYSFTVNFLLDRFPGRLEVALQTLGVFNLLLLAVCAWFTWGKNVRSPKSGVQS